MKVFFLNVLKVFQSRLLKAILSHELDSAADESHQSSGVVKCPAQGHGCAGRIGGLNRIIPPLRLAECPWPPALELKSLALGLMVWSSSTHDLAKRSGGDGLSGCCAIDVF